MILMRILPFSTVGELLVHLRQQVVLLVLRFPIPAWEVEGVQHRRVHLRRVPARAGNRKLGHHHPLKRPGALLQQRLEGPPDVPFVVEFAPPEPLQGFVIGLDRSVRSLQFEVAHGVNPTLNPSPPTPAIPRSRGTSLSTHPARLYLFPIPCSLTSDPAPRPPISPRAQHIYTILNRLEEIPHRKSRQFPYMYPTLAEVGVLIATLFALSKALNFAKKCIPSTTCPAQAVPC
jgi:hypothetical protein